MLETPSRQQREVWTSLSAVVRYTQRLSKAALQGEGKQDVSCTSYQKMRGQQKAVTCDECQNTEMRAAHLGDESSLLASEAISEP